MALSSDPAKRARQLANLRAAPANLRRGGALPGNGLAKTHGAFARVARDRLDERRRAVLDALSADAPLRDPNGELPAADGVTVMLLAQALCRLGDIGTYLTTHGLLDGDGNMRPA